MKAVEKDRSRRYETASGLAADVRHFLQDEPVVARRPSTAYRMQKFVRAKQRARRGSRRRHRHLCLGVIGTSLGLVQVMASPIVELANALEQLRAIALDQAITDTLAGNRAQATCCH